MSEYCVDDKGRLFKLEKEVRALKNHLSFENGESLDDIKCRIKNLEQEINTPTNKVSLSFDKLQARVEELAKQNESFSNKIQNIYKLIGELKKEQSSSNDDGDSNLLKFNLRLFDSPHIPLESIAKLLGLEEHPPITDYPDPMNALRELLRSKYACSGDMYGTEELEKLHQDGKRLSTAEQDHVCYVIGEWYMKWKRGDLNRNIGHAKEELKSMICESEVGKFRETWRKI